MRKIILFFLFVFAVGCSFKPPEIKPGNQSYENEFFSIVHPSSWAVSQSRNQREKSARFKLYDKGYIKYFIEIDVLGPASDIDEDATSKPLIDKNVMYMEIKGFRVVSRKSERIRLGAHDARLILAQGEGRGRNVDMHYIYLKTERFFYLITYHLYDSYSQGVRERFKAVVDAFVPR
ncbi:MAG: hypothetical protein ABIJ41_05170 [Candidatus Omnitrophota bacterium]